MGEKILSWFEKIVTGEKRRWFFAAVIVAIIFPPSCRSACDNFLIYLYSFQMAEEGTHRRKRSFSRNTMPKF